MKNYQGIFLARGFDNISLFQTDDMSLFVKLYEAGVIVFLEINQNYRIGNV